MFGSRAPNAATLLRLFPPAWRARYGEEFLATAGEERLGARQAFDVFMVAIDAWLSADVRNATRGVPVAGTSRRGGFTMLRSILSCDRATTGVTVRDGLIGGGVMIAATLLVSALGIAAQRLGWPVAEVILNRVAFAGPFTISMPWWLMKGQPWKAQAVIIGGTLLVLVGLAWFAS